MSDNIPNLLPIFFQEASENITILEDEILNLENDPTNKDILNKIFRAAHTLKGSSGLVGLKKVQDFTHSVEDFLETLRSNNLDVNSDIISIILDAIDNIKGLIINVQNNQEADFNMDLAPVLEKINTITKGGKSAAYSKSSNSSIEKRNVKKIVFIDLTYYDEIFASGIDPLMFIDDLRGMGNILYLLADDSSIPLFNKFDPEKNYLKWKVILETETDLNDIESIFLFVVDESKIKVNDITEQLSDKSFTSEFEINGEKLTDIIDVTKYININDDNKNDSTKSSTQDINLNRIGGNFIKVDTDKLDKLLNIVSELAIAQSQISQIANNMKGSLGEEIRASSDITGKLSHQLQEQAMSLRMVHLGPTFMKFKRFVRDNSMSMGKELQLVINGQETELDKNMIDKIDDPLKHLIRNAIDHGIETKEERINKNKDHLGTINLSAYYKAGNVVIEIKDDGRGINKEKVLNKAIEKKLINKNQNLTDSEIYNLIFHPGLSTAEKVTDISGRGVGMDVVLSNIKELNGNIEIVSELNKGSTFRLILPLTMAILDGMLASVGSETFIIPIISVVEIFRPEPDSLKTVEGKGEVVNLRDEYISLVRLHDVFDVQDAETDPTKAIIIVVNYSGMRTGILVDIVFDKSQIVMKSLQENFRNVEGVSSATILGDGRVALVIDVNSMINLAYSRGRH